MATRAATALGTFANGVNPPRQAERGRNGAATATCPRCAALFVCGAHAASCWCETLAVLDLKRRLEDLLDKGCVCEACLRAAISASLID